MHDYDFPIRIGTAGAIVSDTGNTPLQKLDDDSARFYGGRFFLCETVAGENAARIVLCWNYCRKLSNDDLRARIGTGKTA